MKTLLFLGILILVIIFGCTGQQIKTFEVCTDCEDFSDCEDFCIKYCNQKGFESAVVVVGEIDDSIIKCYCECKDS